MAKPTYLNPCPRCGTRAFEHLSTHSHCIECLYFEDSYYDHDSALTNALKAEKYLIQLSTKNSRKENLLLKKKNISDQDSAEGINKNQSIPINPKQEAS